MNKQFDVDKLLKQGEITTELELERASLAERKLRLMAKDNPQLVSKRKKLRDLIISYESKHWRNRESISDQRIEESDTAEQLVQIELEFFDSRKKLIRSKLKKLGINQQEFGKILGHDSKSYMSELMNGIVPFTLKDLVVISKLLKINLNKLIPAQLDENDKLKIEQKIKSLGKPKIKLDKNIFAITH